MRLIRLLRILNKMFLSRYAKNPKTRLQMETVYQMRCVEENTPRIEEMVKLRHKKAILLGE